MSKSPKVTSPFSTPTKGKVNNRTFKSFIKAIVPVLQDTYTNKALPDQDAPSIAIWKDLIKAGILHDTTTHATLCRILFGLAPKEHNPYSHIQLANKIIETFPVLEKHFIFKRTQRTLEFYDRDSAPPLSHLKQSSITNHTQTLAASIESPSSTTTTTSDHLKQILGVRNTASNFTATLLPDELSFSSSSSISTNGDKKPAAKRTTEGNEREAIDLTAIPTDPSSSPSGSPSQSSTSNTIDHKDGWTTVTNTNIKQAKRKNPSPFPNNPKKSAFIPISNRYEQLAGDENSTISNDKNTTARTKDEDSISQRSTNNNSPPSSFHKPTTPKNQKDSTISAQPEKDLYELLSATQQEDLILKVINYKTASKEKNSPSTEHTCTIDELLTFIQGHRTQQHMKDMMKKLSSKAREEEKRTITAINEVTSAHATSTLTSMTNVINHKTNEFNKLSTDIDKAKSQINEMINMAEYPVEAFKSNRNNIEKELKELGESIKSDIKGMMNDKELQEKYDGIALELLKIKNEYKKNEHKMDGYFRKKYRLDGLQYTFENLFQRLSSLEKNEIGKETNYCGPVYPSIHKASSNDNFSEDETKETFDTTSEAGNLSQKNKRSWCKTMINDCKDNVE